MDEEKSFVTDINDLDLFFGTKSSYEDFKKKHHIEDKDEKELPEEKEQEEVHAGPKFKLSLDNLRKINEDEMTILRRTRCAHDYDEVFMQSSLEFYDVYYNNNGEISQELREARTIKRSYRNYEEYLEAIHRRNRYFDYLVEKYGEERFIERIQMGMIKEWIPPVPVLSRAAEDYDMYLSGTIPTKTEVQPDGAAEEWLRIMKEEMADVEIEKSYTVEDSIGTAKQVKEKLDEEYSGGSFHSSIGSLDELNKVFHSWYKPGGEMDQSHEIFKNSPENIRKRFEEERPYSEPGLLTKMVNHEEIPEKPINMNEMVKDEKTGRPMTRKEHEQRLLIRFLAENGWSESRLLNYANVGSSLEKAQRKRKARRIRRGGGNSYPVVDTSYMMDETTGGVDPMYSESDDLVNSIFNLMRRD